MNAVTDVPISVVTVCLNAAAVLERTLRSVLDQNYPKLEYIVVDGGSTDGTLAVIEKYRTRLSRVISEPDRGIYDAFNKGVSLAAGDIVGILNAGDLYSPWALTTVAEAASVHPERGVFYGRMAIIDAKLGKWWLHLPGNHNRLVSSMSVSHPASFVRKTVYERHGLFDDSYAISGDWDFMLRVYLAGERFCPIDKVLAAFDNSGISSLPSRLLAAEDRRVCFKHLNFVSAVWETIKIELMYCRRKIMLFLRACRAVCRRGAKIPQIGEHGVSTWDAMWKELSRYR